jgi:type I restriction enzyme, R subunit
VSGSFSESILEQAALAWPEARGHPILHDPDIATRISGAERSDPNYGDGMLEGRLCQALVRLNPDQPLAALRDTLLPRLISGELRIKDAERIVGRVV